MSGHRLLGLTIGEAWPCGPIPVSFRPLGGLPYSRKLCRSTTISHRPQSALTPRPLGFSALRSAIMSLHWGVILGAGMLQ